MDILEARTLYNRDNPDWDREAKILFSCASELDKTGKIGKSILEMAIEKSWIIPDKAKLFLQINQQQMMEEIIDIITSPLRD